MAKKSADEFAQELRDAFAQEAVEQVQSVMELLMALEGETRPEVQAKVTENAFRELHNLKGSAHAVTFTSIESICHPMEDILAALKKGQLNATTDLLDLLLSGVCTVQELLQDESSVNEQTQHELKTRLQTFMKESSISMSSADELDELCRAQGLLAGVSAIEAAEVPKSKPCTAPAAVAASAPRQSAVALEEPIAATAKAAVKSSETMRIATSKLDIFMQKAEEMISIKAMARQQASAAQTLQNSMESWQQVWIKSAPEMKNFRQTMDKLRTGHMSPHEQVAWKKLNELLEQNIERIEQLSTSVKSLTKTAEDYAHSASTAVDVLLDETKRLVMMPCATLFETFPLLVRQLARQLNKETEFTMSGGEIELDKRILSQIKEPLIHILRNSLDHGIEPPEERVKAGKNRRAVMRLSVKHVDGSMVELRIGDDGRGIDINKVKETALSQGLTSSEELSKMSSEQVLGLIFRSSFSTAAEVTEISGRGLGLAIVDESIRKMGGRIRIESELGKGTTFILSLPLTIATFRGVLVETSGKVYVIPTISVDRVVRVHAQDIKPVEGQDTILLGETLVPVCRMEEALELPAEHCQPQAGNGLLTISVLGSGNERIGFVVDEVLEEQEVLVKCLGPVLSKVKKVSGVTILGSGKVVPILNVSDMLNSSSRRNQRLSTGNPGSANQTAQPRRRSNNERKILVVDDTLTARLLLRNIVESAGFQTKTANDGLAALEVLRNEKFDLVVTDIEMPNMNGFELTEAIRSDPALIDMPVIMVTSMTSREDRERGVAAGASAYFVKSSFDQSNLLDVITTLI